MKQREEFRQFFGVKILRHRMQHDEIERMVRHALDILGRDGAMARIEVNRMRAVPEREPARAHARHSASSGPFGPNAGSVKGSGTLRIEATALACSALVRQRLYLPL